MIDDWRSYEKDVQSGRDRLLSGSVVTHATYRGQGTLSIVGAGERAASFGQIFDALPSGLVALRIRGLGAHVVGSPTRCPVARTADDLSDWLRRNEAHADALRTVELGAAPCALSGCEHCERRIAAVQATCAARGVALFAFSMGEVRRLCAMLLTMCRASTRTRLSVASCSAPPGCLARPRACRRCSDRPSSLREPLPVCARGRASSNVLVHALVPAASVCASSIVRRCRFGREFGRFVLRSRSAAAKPSRLHLRRTALSRAVDDVRARLVVEASGSRLRTR